MKGKIAAASPRAWWTIWRTPQHQITRLLWVKSYRPIEPKAPPDVGCCSKIGRGFASLRNVPKGHKQTHAAQQTALVFDHLIGASKKRGSNFKAKCLCGLKIDHELKFSSLIDRQIGGLLAFEDSPD